MGKVTKFTVKTYSRSPLSPDMTVSKINLKDKYQDGEIDLSMCDLQEAPVKEIANFKKAYSLDLSSNHLKHLPQNFILLSHLTKLDLSKNQIEELPENFGELAKLKHLDLYRNNLNHLPLSFSKLKSLKWLDLKDNPLVPRIAEAAGPCLDNKQCQECARNIVLFYTQLQQQVEKEREIREKHRQQNLLINNTTAKKQTQEKKSKKKNNKKEKLENNNCSSKIASDTIKADQNSVIQSDSSNNTKAHGKLSYLFVFYVLLLVVVFIIVLFICTSLDVSQTKNIDKYVRNVWNTGIDKLPEKLRYLAIQTGKHISDIHTFTGTQISRLIEVYIKK